MVSLNSSLCLFPLHPSSLTLSLHPPSLPPPSLILSPPILILSLHHPLYSDPWVSLRHTRLLIALVLGQFLSVLLCGTGVTSQLLASRHATSVPTTQTFITYILLGAIYGVLVVVKSDFLTIFWKNWWKYVILGVVDVEANFLVVLAYKYTNLTTIQVLLV